MHLEIDTLRKNFSSNMSRQIHLIMSVVKNVKTFSKLSEDLQSGWLPRDVVT
jgi:hypothetical protein